MTASEAGDGPGAGSGDGPAASERAVQADWRTIWESELNARAGEREPAEALAAWAGLCGAWFAAARALPVAQGDAGGAAPARSQPPGRAAPAAAAPDACGRAGLVDRLAERVDALERRLAELDRQRA